ncbi:YdcF family protein [Phormidium sp. LEGE 05292]|uniref:YdcF family protein n=1 Tax=[Phormidium] sp. LEGE 05292 TaxID=767427 RepID=UPI00187F0A58|nr:YdcF family protein [Phormidium sp. LEGE 05292]MBE9225616.1 YdcF family protein [Phormidium sp. LEGE 05292]
MKPERKQKNKFRFWLRCFGKRSLLIGLFVLCLVLGILLLYNSAILYAASQKPVGAILVLGGSITREIHVAQLAKQSPEIPILISHGSLAPCILLIFQRAAAPIDNVWLENCANSTFGNFYYNLPILKQWQVNKVKLVTSATHLPRAIWLAQIMLGSHGIWVELEIATETHGVPANRESFFVTTIDVTRGLIWAIVSQFHEPKCTNLIPLSQVDLNIWKMKGFKCERQANLGY